MQLDPIFMILLLVMSVVIHEVCHGYAALALGDPTAKYAGRLTLNPLKHIDPIGSILVPIILSLIPPYVVFGWAKPVPVNPYNFKDQKYGEIKVSLAGPLSNLSIAIFFGLILRFTSDAILLNNPGIAIAFGYIVAINIWLAVFNLIPIPPLDGTWILFSLLPASLQDIKNFLRQYGIVIMVILILFGGSLWIAITDILFQFITGHILTL